MIEFIAGPIAPDAPPLRCDCPGESASAAPVGIRHFCVTQPGRIDLDGKTRRFMGSVLYPAEETAGPHARLTDVLAPCREQALDLLLKGVSSTEAIYLRETLPRLRLRVRRDVPVAPGNIPRPVLLFNPGGENSRASCLPLGEALAAHGYIVLTLDGVRDSPAQVFPDGEIVAPPFLPGESGITPRIADIRFLLDELPSINAHGPLASCLDPDRVGVLGHSRGGYLSTIAAVEDARIRAAVNMDGFPWGVWAPGTGLQEHPAPFQARARAMRTPVLRLVGEQPSHGAAQERFALESRDFGGPFWFAALAGFEHRHFASAPYLCRTSVASVAALERVDEYRHAASVLAPVLRCFFDATLRGTTPDARMNTRDTDFFAVKTPGA